MTAATRVAILNANYLKARLQPHYAVLYARSNGRVAHELIFDLRPLKQVSGVDETDVTMEASFVDDLNADSLDLVELIMSLEEEFGTEISDEDAEKIKTVGDAVQYIEEKV